MSLEEFKISEIEIAYRPKLKASERPKVSKAHEAYNLLLRCWDENKICLIEEFKIVLLNRGNRVLGVMHVAQGGMEGVLIDPKIIMATALKGAATSIVLAHNHPSGKLEPSKQDIRLTNRIVRAGDLLGIKVVDHLILTDDGYYSFSKDGILGV